MCLKLFVEMQCFCRMSLTDSHDTFADGLMPLQGAYVHQLRLIGNAVPLFFGWAILGAVFEAAYGDPAPKPAFLADRPAWNGKKQSFSLYR